MVVKAIVPAQGIELQGTVSENFPEEPRSAIDQTEVIEACVDAVLRILEKRDRR